MILDKQLRIFLRRKGVTASQLGRATRISPKTIYNWLDGQSPRDIRQVKRVADYFGVSLDLLCYGVEERADASPIDVHRRDILAGVFEVVLRKARD